MSMSKAAAFRETLTAQFRRDARGLIDRALISVSPRAYAEFLKRLDAPAKPNTRLRKTMAAPLPWKDR